MNFADLYTKKVCLKYLNSLAPEFENFVKNFQVLVRNNYGNFCIKIEIVNVITFLYQDFLYEHGFYISEKEQYTLDRVSREDLEKTIAMTIDNITESSYIKRSIVFIYPMMNSVSYSLGDLFYRKWIACYGPDLTLLEKLNNRFEIAFDNNLTESIKVTVSRSEFKQVETLQNWSKQIQELGYIISNIYSEHIDNEEHIVYIFKADEESRITGNRNAILEIRSKFKKA